MNNIKFSKYLSISKNKDWVAIYHRLKPNPIFLKSTIWNNLSNQGNDKIINKLKQENLIIKSNIEDDNIYKKIFSKYELKLNKVKILYLVFSNICNINCKYCPLNDIKDHQLLKFDTAKKGIDIWVNHISPEDINSFDYYIIFYGGEPLLNFQLFEPVLKYLKKQQEDNKLQKKLNIMVCTNGLLITKQMIILFKKYNILLAIGHDGPKKFNDYYRIDTNNKTTSTRIENNIKLLRKNNINVSISISITPKNIIIANKLYKFFKKLGINKMGFNILKGKYLLSIMTQKEIKQYFHKAINVIFNCYKSNSKKLFEYQAEKKYYSFNKKDFFPPDCTCYGSQIVILPDGTISNCPFKRDNIINVNKADLNFRIWNSKKIQKLRNRLPVYNKKLNNLSAISLYGGGCSWSTYELKHDEFALDYPMYLLAKKFFRYFIWSKFNKKYEQNNNRNNRRIWYL